MVGGKRRREEDINKIKYKNNRKRTIQQQQPQKPTNKNKKTDRL
jgi:hypothetical protein